MLSKRQFEAANALLKHLEKREGKSSLDDYPFALRELGFENVDRHSLVDFLIDCDLIYYAGDTDYWIKLRPDGYKAAKIGIEKYFEEIEQDKQLDRDEKRANITGVETAIKNSKNSKTFSLIAIGISLLVPFLVVKFDNHVNRPENQTDTNGKNRQETTNSVIPLQLADTVLIKELKNLLKHDTLFLEELKKGINEKPTRKQITTP